MTARIGTIVVGVDSVQGTDPVLEPAVRFAERHGATVHVVHGFMLTDPLLDAYARAGYLGDHTLTNFGQELGASLERLVSSIQTSTTIHARAVAGPPVAAIQEVVDEVGADLVVVGASRHGRFPLSLLGSTCRALARRSTVPVLVLRPDSSVEIVRVLAPTDLSEHSAAAFAWAQELAGGATHGELRAVLVINESLMLLPLEQRLLDRVAQEEMDSFLGSRPREGLSATGTVRKGDPASEILAEAESWNADLVVVGTHARKGMERLLLGSVAESALKSAPCHVLVVPPPAKAGGEREAGVSSASAAPPLGA
jgi:nucleotide-binding universal stress UspA family protein